MTTFASLYQQLHGGCFARCVEDNDQAFMTITEGKCFRNCMTKMSYFYPTLRKNLENSPYHAIDAETRAAREELGIPQPDYSLGFD